LDENCLELLAFEFGFCGERTALDVNLVFEELLLGAHGEVLAATHRESARHQTGKSGKPHDIVARIGTGESQNERDVSDKTVEKTKERRSKTTVSDLSVMGLTGHGRHCSEPTGAPMARLVNESDG
jgi:hypothetical protein